MFNCKLVYLKSFYNEMKIFVMKEHVIKLFLLIFPFFLVGSNNISKVLSASVYGCICQGISDEISNIFHLQISQNKELFNLFLSHLKRKKKIEKRTRNHSLKPGSVDRA